MTAKAPFAAPIVNPRLAAVLANERDPVEALSDDQGPAIMVWKAGTADLMLKQGRPVLLACGHFTITRSVHRAKCSRCGEMIRSGYDYEAFRNRGAEDVFSWPADPLRILHEKR